MSQVLVLLKKHPQWLAVESVYHSLQAHGYRAFLAGGCVRDALLGMEARDLDIATDAAPEDIEKIFKKTVAVGKSFGVMRVLESGSDIEVATFRTDGDYKDGRRPDFVTFSSPEEDAQRRDFTVNALFYDLASDKVLDFVEGQADLRKKVIRTVGAPERRFSEDNLRLLRAVRFVAQLGFVIDGDTKRAIQKMAGKVMTVSGERLRDEWLKLLKSPYVEEGLREAVATGLMAVLFPYRNKDDSFTKTPWAEESWQFLALFLRSALNRNLAEALDLLKLSSRERRNIEDSWRFWNEDEFFWPRRQGEKLQLLAKPGVYFAFRVDADKNDEARYHDLISMWISLGESLPAPFLTGEDVRSHLQGVAIGQCLQEAYVRQLEKSFNSRGEALSWLTTYLKGMS